MENMNLNESSDTCNYHSDESPKINKQEINYSNLGLSKMNGDQVRALSIAHLHNAESYVEEVSDKYNLPLEIRRGLKQHLQDTHEISEYSGSMSAKNI